MKKILIISLLCTASFASLAQEDVEEVIVTAIFNVTSGKL